MANTVISPNMNLPVPVVGTDPGPDWANNINACLSAIDSHNHTNGQGVPIGPQGLNINADLPMNNNNLTLARSLRFQSQSTALVGPADLGELYELEVDLWYVDGAGNQVRITQGGSVTGATGTITGLPSGTASASFAGSTFTFQSATNTPATLSAGPLIIGQPISGGFAVTMTPSVSQAANYSLTLPIALPTSQSALVSDASGNESFLELLTTTYTPVISDVTGGTSFASAGPMMVTRTGNIVQVAGKITWVVAVAGSFASWIMTLPISRTAGNFTFDYQASGTCSRSSPFFSGSGPQVGSVEAIPVTQQVICSIVTNLGNLEGSASISFSYSLTNI